MYAIYGNIYHQYTRIPYMDPMGKRKIGRKLRKKNGHCDGQWWISRKNPDFTWEILSKKIS
jgi:hypothetical protein